MMGISKPEFVSFFAVSNLSACVTTVNDDVCSCGVGASIAGEVEVYTLQLSGVGVTLQWGQVEPLLLHLKWAVSAHLGVDVSGADAVDTSEVGPFDGQ